MLYRLNELVSSIVWGPPMLAAFLGVGLFLTLRSRLFQFTHIGTWMRETLIAAFRDRSVRQSTDGNSISQFQALTAALAACMGTGNIVGVATAICAGGPGAVFWMWLSAALGMMTCCVENILGLRFRYRDSAGEWMGGAMVYLERGLGMKKTAKLFCALLVLSSFGVGNMTQTNSIAAALEESFSFPPAATGLVVAALAGLVIIGGIQRIASVAEKLIPLISVLFLLVSFFVIFQHRDTLPQVLRLIMEQAFGVRALAGFGIAKAMRYGIARGVFSNEAGLGSSAIIHAAADVEKPATQGMWGILEVFLDTVLMCTVTAFTILCSGVWSPGGSKNGAQLSAAAFASSFGRWGSLFVGVSVAIFAFATLIGWSYYGKRGTQYLFGHRAQWVYLLVYILAAFLGCVIKLEAVWSFSDTLNGLMAIPNLLAVTLLSGQALRELKKEGLTNLSRRRLGQGR